MPERCRAERSSDELKAAFGVDGIPERVASFNRDNFAVKKGCALMPVCFGISFTKSHLNQGNALVHVYTDGSVSVTTGGIEMGQGISSNVAAVVARTFGISRRRVRVESTNTTRVANMSPSAASATTDLNGNAAIIAVQTILDGMREVAATELGAADDAEVTVADEQVLVAGEPADMNWTDLVGLTYRARRRLSAHGYYVTPGIRYDEEREHGHPFAYHVYGTAVFEVTVDCLRGTYAVDQVKIVHDLGRTINPTVDRGQVEGGAGAGHGLDDHGRPAVGRARPLPVPRPVHLQGSRRLLHARRHGGEVPGAGRQPLRPARRQGGRRAAADVRHRRFLRHPQRHEGLPPQRRTDPQRPHDPGTPPPRPVPDTTELRSIG